MNFDPENFEKRKSYVLNGISIPKYGSAVWADDGVIQFLTIEVIDNSSHRMDTWRLRVKAFGFHPDGSMRGKTYKQYVSRDEGYTDSVSLSAFSPEFKRFVIEKLRGE